ncbi:MAG: hypothetical protein LC754_03250 [Acidobacteria bacterium]|nr:hypothetical protein [Acidobacteriota bacterium]
MKKTFARLLLLPLAALFALASVASAQGLVDAQRTRSALSTFPDSQAVLFFNVQRIIREALPRVVPPAELQKHLAEARKVGFDPNSLEYVIIGVRLADTLAPGVVPDFVVLVKGNGDFNADALLALARLGISTQGMQSTQETYGSKTINLVKLNKDAATDDKTTPPKKFPLNEIAATALDANTLVIGVPGYVRAAIDAAGGGQGRLDAGLVDLSMRNPTALSSLTVVVPETLPGYLQKMGAPTNEEINKIIGWLKRVSLSTGMTALDFNFRAAIQLDNAEHASALSGIVRMGLMAAENAIGEDLKKKRGHQAEAQAAMLALRSFTNTTQGDVVLLGTSVPQKTVAALVKQNTSPPPAQNTKRTPGQTRGRKRPVKRG